MGRTPSTIELHFDRNYQPNWDPSREPKPPKVKAGSIAPLPKEEASKLLKAKICSRAEDMPDAEPEED